MKHNRKHYGILLCAVVLCCLLISSVPLPQSTKSTEPQIYVQNELLVRFAYETNSLHSRSRVQFRKKILENHSITVLHQWKNSIEHWHLGKGDLQSTIDSLNNSPHIIYAEPNYILKADLIPSDTDFQLQWGLFNNGQTGGLDDADIDATQAWDISTGNSEILVGIIDSGIDYYHPDLQKNVWINSGEIPDNGLDDDENGYIDDYRGYDFLNDVGDPIDEHGHGTHVAGIIGAVGNNDMGMAGVSWAVQLLPLKFLGADNSGPASAAITAIEYAIDAGVDILNASWGNVYYSQALADAIDLADEADILVVSSAGNSASDNDLYPHYPSDLPFDHIISVASTDHTDQLSVFSNWGLENVDLAAPGTAIYSTLTDSSFGTMSGTSMATPHVTGALVLIRSVFPQMTPIQLKEQLLNSVDVKLSLIGLMTSAGRLNAGNALGSEQLQDIALKPAIIDFGIEILGQTSEIQTVSIENLSSQIIYIDSINVNAGFQISNEDGLDPGIGPFQTDSIGIRFLPQQLQDYNQMLKIYYHTSPGSQKNIGLQLMGEGVTGTILQAGPVSGTWSNEESPFYIEGDIIISSGSSLTIEPGTKIQFEGHYSFKVGESAVLDAQGTVEDSIVFTARDARFGWNGLQFLDSGSDDFLSYCRIEYGIKSSSAVNLEDQRGGGIYCSNTNPQIEHSLIFNNQAEGGGGICLTNSDATLNNVSIMYNEAGLDGGGGIYLDDSNPLLFRVIISHNTSINWFQSGDNGGAIYSKDSSPSLFNVTISENFADRGGGIFFAKSSTKPIIINSILWGNTPNQIEFSTDASEKSIAISFSDIMNGPSGIVAGNTVTVYYLGGNINGDPKFINAEDADFRLNIDSPCIDSGIQDTLILFNDQQDTIHIPDINFEQYGPDLGAVESTGMPLCILSLSEGWNLVGWNIHTAAQSPAQRFNEILPNLDVALSFEEEGLTYDPQIEDTFNTLNTTDHFHGYWLRMNSPDHLVISGDPVEFPASILLEKGWNLVSYLPQFSDSTRIALGSILDNIVLIEAFDGGALSFDPMLPDTINTLHTLLPGYGYWIKMIEEDTLIFFETGTSNAQASTLAAINNMYLPSVEIYPTNEWINVYASSMDLNGEFIGQKIKITAYDPDGIICGEMQADASGYFKMMPVYRDDFRTIDLDEGAQPGDSITFLINDIRIPVKVLWQYSGQIEDISNFVTHIDGGQNSEKQLSYLLKQNYPNPFNSQSVVHYQVPEPVKVTIEVYNILGQRVRILLDAHKKRGEYQIVWDGKNENGRTLSSGIYFCRMAAAQYVATKKMMLLK